LRLSLESDLTAALLFSNSAVLIWSLDTFRKESF